MPCNAVATARARVDVSARAIVKLGALANVDVSKLREMLDAVCRKQFASTYFNLELDEDGTLTVDGASKYENALVLAFAQKALKAIAQKFIAAKVSQAVKVTGQQYVQGSIIMEVEL